MRVILILVLLSLGLITSAFPAASLPPARYDRAHPDLRVERFAYLDVDPQCRKAFPKTKLPAATDTHRITGCAPVSDGKLPCFVMMPRRGDLPPAHLEAIFRHERAHCNGWPADHPSQ